MPRKEEQFSKSTRRGRSKRRGAERRERNSLADSSTPVDARSTQKTTNSKYNIQEKKLPPILENIITAITVSNIEQDKDNSSESSCNSNISDIERKKLHTTTVKKKEEQRNLPM